jgi:hypothetical protein
VGWQNSDLGETANTVNIRMIEEDEFMYMLFRFRSLFYYYICVFSDEYSDEDDQRCDFIFLTKFIRGYLDVFQQNRRSNGCTLGNGFREGDYEFWCETVRGGQMLGIGLVTILVSSTEMVE